MRKFMPAGTARYRGLRSQVPPHFALCKNLPGRLKIAMPPCSSPASIRSRLSSATQRKRLHTIAYTCESGEW